MSQQEILGFRLVNKKIMMRYFLLGFFIVNMFFLSSCKDDRQGVDLIYTEFVDELIIPGQNTFQHHAYVNTINARWSDFMGDLTIDDVSGIEPFFANINNAFGEDLDFIDEVILEIFPNQDATLTPWEFAFRTNVPFNTGVQIDLVPSLSPFKDELVDNVFTYKLRVRYRQSPPRQIPLVLNFGFRAYPK